MEQNKLFATGRRKNASARVSLLGGSGKIIINGKPMDEFFNGLERHKKDIMKAVAVLPSPNSYDIVVNVRGGGITGQAGAISLGIARSILKIDPALRQNLRKEDLLTRDPRMVERKKPGRPKARKRFQYGKR